MVTLTHILIGIGAVVLWSLFVLITPTTRCHRCHGKKVIRTRFRKRIKTCPRCRGQRKQFRRGAITVHRLAEPARDALKQRIRNRRDPKEKPRANVH